MNNVVRETHLMAYVPNTALCHLVDMLIQNALQLSKSIFSESGATEGTELVNPLRVPSFFFTNKWRFKQ